MSEISEKLLTKLEMECEKTLTYFRNLMPRDWEVKTYSDGAAWSVNDVLTHIVIAERSLGELMENIVSKGSNLSENFDLNEFNERTVAATTDKNSSVLLERFTKDRKKNINMIKNFSDEDLIKVGSHPYFGEAKIGEMIKLMMLHINLHIRDIRRTIKESNENN